MTSQFLRSPGPPVTFCHKSDKSEMPHLYDVIYERLHIITTNLFKNAFFWIPTFFIYFILVWDAGPFYDIWCPWTINNYALLFKSKYTWVVEAVKFYKSFRARKSQYITNKQTKIQNSKNLGKWTKTNYIYKQKTEVTYYMYNIT